MRAKTRRRVIQSVCTLGACAIIAAAAYFGYVTFIAGGDLVGTWERTNIEAAPEHLANLSAAEREMLAHEIAARNEAEEMTWSLFSDNTGIRHFASGGVSDVHPFAWQVHEGGILETIEGAVARILWRYEMTGLGNNRLRIVRMQDGEPAEIWHFARTE